MEPSFIRQQMEARLAEFSMYCRLYIESCEREQKNMKDLLSKESLDQFKNVLKNLKEIEETTREYAFEIDFSSTQLRVIHGEYISELEKKLVENENRLTSTHGGITIVRIPLKWSSYGHSAGYDEAYSLLDIEYQGGKVYRYKNVPKTLFERIKTLSSLRDLKKIIDGLEFEKLN